jgi:hypothetical protein
MSAWLALAAAPSAPQLNGQENISNPSTRLSITAATSGSRSSISAVENHVHGAPRWPTAIGAAPRTLQRGRGAVEKIYDRQCAGRGGGRILVTFNFTLNLSILSSTYRGGRGGPQRAPSRVAERRLRLGDLDPLARAADAVRDAPPALRFESDAAGVRGNDYLHGRLRRPRGAPLGGAVPCGEFGHGARIGHHQGRGGCGGAHGTKPFPHSGSTRRPGRGCP